MRKFYICEFNLPSALWAVGIFLCSYRLLSLCCAALCPPVYRKFLSNWFAGQRRSASISGWAVHPDRSQRFPRWTDPCQSKRAHRWSHCVRTISVWRSLSVCRSVGAVISFGCPSVHSALRQFLRVAERTATGPLSNPPPGRSRCCSATETFSIQWKSCAPSERSSYRSTHPVGNIPHDGNILVWLWFEISPNVIAYTVEPWISI